MRERRGERARERERERRGEKRREEVCVCVRVCYDKGRVFFSPLCVVYLR